MADHDAVHVHLGNLGRGLIPFGGRYYHVEVFFADAKALQLRAVRAKLAGEHNEAVLLYRKLLPYLSKIDELELNVLPKGLQTQVAMRAIEELEAVGH